MAYDFDESYLDSLFEQAENFLDSNPYLNLGEAQSFYTKVVGVTMNGRQEVIQRLTLDTAIILQREPTNSYDSNAVMVVTENNEQIGYLNRKLALVLAPILDQGQDYQVYISSITGGTEGHNYGVNLLIVKDGLTQDSLDTGIRSRLAALNESALFEELRKAVLGEWDYHEKQEDAINALLQGENVLAVFGTGRGKSAIFQTVAAYKAIRENKVTVIVYPLRALSNDQYSSMQRMFSRLGLRVYKANGSLSTEERTIFFNAAAQNDVDIILTTPEFLLHHSSKLGPLLERIGLFVVDESHHIAVDSHRPAYRHLDRIVELLNKPQILAVTATANDETAREIIEMLGISEVIIDAHTRENLSLIDSRGIKGKDQYVLDVVGMGKTIIYVGTRKEAVRLATTIRDKVPGFFNKVGFYHGGMSSTDRGNIEEMFRTGFIQCVVSTSAFGEGINVPDVTDVILYHMMYSLTEFNQMSGRAGRGGQSAKVHLLFGRSDGVINFNIVKNQAPTREQIVCIYKVLRTLPGNSTNNEIAEKTKKISQGAVQANETLVSCALGILEELGMISRETIGNKREISIIPNPSRNDLTNSLRFQEGVEELDEFNRFRDEILALDQGELLGFVQKPICPRTNVLIQPKQTEVCWL